MSGKNETNESIERRYFPVGELRAKQADGKTSIEGLAAVFNELSDDLGGWRERIEPGFFSKVLGDDVRALWNHNSDMPLARTANETLKLSETKDGLDVKFEPNETSWGKDATAAILRGDVNQMSFAFTVCEDGATWEQVGSEIIRTLKAGGCRQLYDVSPVTYPAYPQTSVGARSQFETFQKTCIPPEAQAGGGESKQAEGQAQARHDLLRKKLDLAEKE